jgi:hypothetical protein
MKGLKATINGMFWYGDMVKMASYITVIAHAKVA